jgi:phospholipid/cholesterol/gamma-HCH transport system permease protein
VLGAIDAGSERVRGALRARALALGAPLRALAEPVALLAATAGAVPGVRAALVAEQVRRMLAAAGPEVALAAALVATGFVRGVPIGPEPDAARAGLLAWVRAGAPLVAALVACARVAAGQAGELAAMRAGLQLDALRVMGADPVRHWAAPRILGAAAALPLLVVLADGAGLAALWVLGAPAGALALGVGDVAPGLARGVVLGAAVAAAGASAGLAAPRVELRVAGFASARAAARGAARALVWVLALHAAFGGGWPT